MDLSSPQSRQVRESPIAAMTADVPAVTPPASEATEKKVVLSCEALSSLTKFGVAPSWAADYIAFWVKNPDPGSSFAKVARWVNWMPPRTLLALMQGLRYDGLICRRGEHVVGHLFFQRHGDTLHMFSVWIAPELQGEGRGTALVRAFVEWSRARSDIAAVRLGAGGDPRVRAIVNKLHQSSADLGISVDDRSFVHFVDRRNRPDSLEVRLAQERALPINN